MNINNLQGELDYECKAIGTFLQFHGLHVRMHVFIYLSIRQKGKPNRFMYFLSVFISSVSQPIRLSLPFSFSLALSLSV